MLNIGDKKLKTIHSNNSIISYLELSEYELYNSDTDIPEYLKVFKRVSTITKDRVDSLHIENIGDIIIPKNVKSVEAGAFSSCNNVSHLTITQASIPQILDNVLTDMGFNEDKTLVITVSKTKGEFAEGLSIPVSFVLEISEGCTSLAAKTFYNCDNLVGIKIPDTVSKIGFQTFDGCTGLKEITMPCSAEFGSSFTNCTNIEKVTLTKGTGVMPEYTTGLPGTGYKDGIYFAWTPWYISRNVFKTLILEDGIVNIADYVFVECEKITNIIIPDTVTSIGKYAFAECKAVQTITLGNNVASIGYSAFYYCDKITSITIPDSVVSIGSDAFYSCLNLSNITIGNSVTRVGESAFNNTAYYKEATNWNNSVLYIGNILIRAKSGLPNEYSILDNTTCVADAAFYNFTDLTSIIIPNSIIAIGRDAFSGCTGLISVYINDLSSFCGIQFNSVKSNPLAYAQKLYVNNELLTDLVISDSITNISALAFYNYISVLESITVSKDNQVYDSRDDCNAIINSENNSLILGCKNTVIPNTVTNIGDYSFYGCNDLTNASIPNTVTNIGAYAFCSTGLMSVSIPESVTNIGVSAFSKCNSLSDATIECSIIGDSAFHSCVELSNLSISNNTTHIGSFSFYNCSYLTSVTIPNSVTYIGRNAFDSTGITSVIIPNSVTYMGTYAFPCMIEVQPDFNAELDISNISYTSEAITNILNNLKDLSGEDKKKIRLGSNNYNKLSTEHWNIAMKKNWSLTKV